MVVKVFGIDRHASQPNRSLTTNDISHTERCRPIFCQDEGRPIHVKSADGNPQSPPKGSAREITRASLQTPPGKCTGG
jgi:hypothetical protein